MGLVFDRLDHDGFAEILRSDELAAVVHAAAEGIAGAVDTEEDPEDGVAIDDYVTDRVGSSVTIRDPRAMLWEARDGILIRAAAAQGLDVKAKAS